MSGRSPRRAGVGRRAALGIGAICRRNAIYLRKSPFRLLTPGDPNFEDSGPNFEDSGEAVEDSGGSAGFYTFLGLGLDFRVVVMRDYESAARFAASLRTLTASTPLPTGKPSSPP